MLRAGVRLFQVRFKKTPYDEQVDLGRKLRELTRSCNTIFIVNDSPGLAAEIEADGVHLGADDPHVPAARALLGTRAIIGVSCYDEVERVTRRGSEEIAYIGLSSPYPSPTKQKDVVSLSDFKNLVAASCVPVYAIGGITLDKVGEMIQAGCHGVAVISAIFGKQNPAEAVREFLAELERFT